MKIGTVIVTFNPDVKQLIRNLTMVSKQVSLVYIIDNGSKNFSDIISLRNKYSNVKIIGLGKNTGIAKAQNVGFEEFRKLEFGWVLTLDQDSIIPSNYVEKLVPVTLRENVGLVTGAYIDTKWNASRINLVRAKRKPDIQSVNEEISSGNLVSMDVWQQVGGFSEELFIDYVDFDFDYKMAEHGYYLYRVNNAEFKHEIGNLVKNGFLTTILLLNNRDLFDHSAQRLYYMNRNRIIVRKRHKQFGSPWKMLLHEIVNLREILVMSGSRYLKLRKALKGIFDGLLIN